MNRGDLVFLANDLMSEYADLIDSNRFEDWLGLFTEEASYRVIPRENVEQNLPISLMLCTNKAMLRDRVTALRQANEFNLHYDRHLISGVRIKLASERIWQIEASYAVIQTDMEGRSHLFSVGSYQDKVRLDGERMLFTEKLVVVDSFSIPNLLAIPL